MQEGGTLRENDRVRQEKLRGEIKKKGKLRDSPKQRLEDKPQSHRDVRSETDTRVHMHTDVRREMAVHTRIHTLEERERTWQSTKKKCKIWEELRGAFFGDFNSDINLRKEGNRTSFLSLLKLIMCPELELTERTFEHSLRGHSPPVDTLQSVRTSCLRSQNGSSLS